MLFVLIQFFLNHPKKDGIHFVYQHVTLLFQFSLYGIHVPALPNGIELCLAIIAILFLHFSNTMYSIILVLKSWPVIILECEEMYLLMITVGTQKQIWFQPMNC